VSGFLIFNSILDLQFRIQIFVTTYVRMRILWTGGFNLGPDILCLVCLRGGSRHATLSIGNDTNNCASSNHGQKFLGFLLRCLLPLNRVVCTHQQSRTSIVVCTPLLSLESANNGLRTQVRRVPVEGYGARVYHTAPSIAFRAVGLFVCSLALLIVTFPIPKFQHRSKISYLKSYYSTRVLYP
jgi:hypothetical protein